MADELNQLADGSWSMLRAADTDTSWHGKETVMPVGASFDDWLNHRVFDWKIKRSKVRYNIDHAGTQLEMAKQHVLFRSDNHKPLSVVSEDYHIVQPRQVLEFFHDLCEKNHLTMDTAGVIRDGVKFWALARTGNQVNVGGSDAVKQYVLLASSADSSMATTAKHTSLRVVCSNTFHQSVGNGEAAVRIRHSRAFDETEVKLNLGMMDEHFTQFGEYANEMHRMSVSVSDAQRWMVELLSERNDLDEEQVAEFIQKSRVFKGFWGGFTQGRGAEQTLWGLFNGVTYTVDHVKGRSFDTRFDSAQFGQGANLKQRAWDKALQVIHGARVANDALIAAAA